MSQWIDRVNAHPFVSRLNQALTLMESAERIAKGNAQAIEAADKIRSVLSYVKKRFESTDPLLVAFSQLNVLDSALQNVGNELRNYNGDQNVGHLTNAVSHCDSVLASAVNAIPLLAVADIEGLRDTSTTFRSSVMQHFKNTEQEVTTLTSRLGELEKRSKTLEQEFTTAEQQRRTEFQSGVSSDRKAFADLRTTTETELRALRNEWNSNFAKTHGEQDEALKSSLKKSVDTTENVLQQLNKRSAATMDELEAHRKRGEELVGIIANTGMATGFQRVADVEAKRASKWQLAAGISMVGLIGFAIWAFYLTIGKSFEWETLGTRLFVAVAFGLATVYAARQADRHRLNERTSRKLELILLSLNPYLADLPADEQHKLKAKLAEQIFVAEHAEPDSKDSVPATNLFDLLKIAVDNVTKMKK